MKTIGILVLIIFTNMLGFGLTLPLTPYFKIHFALNQAQAGMLSALFPLAQMISSPILGTLSDKIGRKKILYTSILLVAFSYLLLAFSTTYQEVVISRLLSGFFNGSLAVAMACVSDISSIENRMKYMGLSGMAFGLGFLFGPALGGLLAGADNAHANIQLVGIVSFLMCLISFFLIVFKLPETRSKAHIDAPVQPKTEIEKGQSNIFNFLLNGIVSLAIATLEVFVSIWLAEAFKLGPQYIGIFWAYFAIIMNSGRVLFIKYMKNYNHVAIAFAIASIGFFGFIFSSSLILVCLFVLFIGCSFGVLLTTISTKISLKGSPDKQGFLFGVNNAIGNTGRFIGPISIGYIIHSFNSLNLGWISLGVILLAGSLMALKLHKAEN